MTDVRLADPAVVVLVGASGSGKSRWAAERFRVSEIVSSDALRAVVGSGPADLDASVDAFALLDQIVAARLSRSLTTVIDTLGLDPERRAFYLHQARAAGLPAVLVIMNTPAALCRRRNRDRDRPVPAPVITEQLRRVRSMINTVADEGWDEVLIIDSPVDAPVQPVPPSADDDHPSESGPRVILQISRFPWGEDPIGWLRDLVLAADALGFHGIALMDHLIQIPQVDRAWEPIPEPWVTLGLLCGLDTKLRLGTLVSPVTFREPGIIAKTVATLDALSGGRTFCGLGAGWWLREHQAYGLDFPAAGERRTLRIVAEQADGANLPSNPKTLLKKIGILHEHCAAVGRDPETVEITVLDLPIIGTDREDVAVRVERLRGRTPAAAFAARHHAGPADDHARRYRELAALGVGTVFLSLPDLAGADDLSRCAPLFERG